MLYYFAYVMSVAIDNRRVPHHISESTRLCQRVGEQKRKCTKILVYFPRHLRRDLMTRDRQKFSFPLSTALCASSEFILGIFRVYREFLYAFNNNATLS